MNKKHIFGVVAAVLLLVLAAWGLGWFGDGRYSDDPVVAELQKERDAGFAQQEQMSEDERRAAREGFRERMEGLTEEQRRAFFESSMPIFMQMFQRRIDEFLALSPEKQREEMDKRIDEMQARGAPPGGPRGFGQPPDPQQIDQMRKRMLDWTTPDQRANFEKAMTMFQERMQERGVSPGPGGGFF